MAVLEAPEAPAPVEAVAAPVAEPVAEKFEPITMREKPDVTPDAQRIAESRKALEHPLSAGQRFFEAPDGFIVVAEADRSHIRDRRSGHVGEWINPRR